MNYFIKIRTGADTYAHATIWRKTDQSVQVTKVETGKSQTERAVRSGMCGWGEWSRGAA